MKKTLLGTAAVLALISAPVFAGSPEPSDVDDMQILVPQEAASSSSIGSLGSAAGGGILPLAGMLLLGIGIAAATASN